MHHDMTCPPQALEVQRQATTGGMETQVRLPDPCLQLKEAENQEGLLGLKGPSKIYPYLRPYMELEGRSARSGRGVEGPLMEPVPLKLRFRMRHTLQFGPCWKGPVVELEIFAASVHAWNFQWSSFWDCYACLVRMTLIMEPKKN